MCYPKCEGLWTNMRIFRIQILPCGLFFPILFGPISAATISFISSQRRDSKPSNFAILLVFLTLNICVERSAFKNMQVAVWEVAFRARKALGTVKEQPLTTGLVPNQTPTCIVNSQLVVNFFTLRVAFSLYFHTRSRSCKVLGTIMFFLSKHPGCYTVVMVTMNLYIISWTVLDIAKSVLCLLAAYA